MFRSRPHSRIGHDIERLVWTSDGPRTAYRFQRNALSPVFHLVKKEDTTGDRDIRWMLSVPAFGVVDTRLSFTWGSASRRVAEYVRESEHVEAVVSVAASSYPKDSAVSWYEPNGRRREGRVASDEPTAIQNWRLPDYGTVYVDVEVADGYGPTRTVWRKDIEDLNPLM